MRWLTDLSHPKPGHDPLEFVDADEGQQLKVRVHQKCNVEPGRDRELPSANPICSQMADKRTVTELSSRQSLLSATICGVVDCQTWLVTLIFCGTDHLSETSDDVVCVRACPSAS